MEFLDNSNGKWMVRIILRKDLDDSNGKWTVRIILWKLFDIFMIIIIGYNSDGQFLSF